MPSWANSDNNEVNQKVKQKISEVNQMKKQLSEDNIPTRDDGFEVEESESVSDEFAHDSDSEKETKQKQTAEKHKSSPNRDDLKQTLSKN
jgi:hypothetical protein